MGWKMVYTVLDVDEKTKRNIHTFDQNIRTVYSNKTTHPEPLECKTVTRVRQECYIGKA